MRVKVILCYSLLAHHFTEFGSKLTMPIMIWDWISCRKEMSHFIMTEQDCNQEYNSGLNTYHNLYIYVRERLIYEERNVEKLIWHIWQYYQHGHAVSFCYFLSWIGPKRNYLVLQLFSDVSTSVNDPDNIWQRIWNGRLCKNVRVEMTCYTFRSISAFHVDRENFRALDNSYCSSYKVCYWSYWQCSPEKKFLMMNPYNIINLVVMFEGLQKHTCISY